MTPLRRQLYDAVMATHAALERGDKNLNKIDAHRHELLFLSLDETIQQYQGVNERERKPVQFERRPDEGLLE